MPTSDNMSTYKKIGGNVVADILSLFVTYFAIVAGVVISVILPILRQWLPKPSANRNLKTLGSISKPYLILMAFSLVVGLLIVASIGDNLTDWRVSLLLGYAWDSSLQKFANKPITLRCGDKETS